MARNVVCIRSRRRATTVTVDIRTRPGNIVITSDRLVGSASDNLTNVKKGKRTDPIPAPQ